MVSTNRNSLIRNTSIQENTGIPNVSSEAALLTQLVNENKVDNSMDVNHNFEDIHTSSRFENKRFSRFIGKRPLKEMLLNP